MDSEPSIQNSFNSIDCSPEQLLHELQVRQVDLQFKLIELEVQNEHLRSIQTQREESNSYYADLFNNAPVGYLSLSEKGLISDANITAAKLLEIDRLDLLSTSFARLVTAQHSDRWYLFCRELKNNKQQGTITLSLKSCDDTVMSVRLDCLWINSTLRITLSDLTTTKQVIPDASPAELRLTAKKIKDEELIRLQNMTNEALEQSNQYLKLAIISGQVGIWQYNLQTNELIWDDTMFALYGSNRKGFLGAYSDWSTRLHPDDKVTTEAAVQNAISGKKSYNSDFRVIWANGEVHHLKGHAHVLMNEAGNPQHMVGTNWDNSAFAHTNQQLLLARAAIDNSKSAFIWLTEDGHVADINNFASISLGYTQHELKSLHVWDFDIELSAESWPDAWAQLKKSGKYQGESLHRRKNGTFFPVEVVTDFIVINGKEYSFSFINDNTKRKQIELKLRAADAFNISILNSLTAHIAVLDNQGVITATNHAWRQFSRDNALPETNQAMLGINYLNACNQPTAKEANTGISAVLSGELKEFNLEYPCHSANEKRWFQMNVTRLKGLNEGVVVSHKNITLRHKMQALLQEKERMLSESQRIAHIGSWSFNLATGYLVWSEEMYTIFGVTPETFAHTQEAIDLLIHPEDLEQRKKWLTKCSKGKRMKELISRIQLPDGSIRFVCTYGELQYDDMNKPDRLLGTTQDISERKYKENLDKEHLDQLAHVTRLSLMGEMASGLAHEVNQPLTAISTYAQVSLNLLKKESPDLIKLGEVAVKTKDQALRAGQIIHRMKRFGTSKSQQRSTADINELINQCVSLCADFIKQNSIVVKLELPDNLPVVHIDHIQIEQVLINLIRNGIDAILGATDRQHGEITIQSQLTLENKIQVSVKDNGPGIEEDQQSKVLMPFHTTKEDGMGMGLSISRSLIEAHNGTLSFNSEFGKGCTFYFILPI